MKLFALSTCMLFLVVACTGPNGRRPAADAGGSGGQGADNGGPGGGGAGGAGAGSGGGVAGGAGNWDAAGSPSDRTVSADWEGPGCGEATSPVPYSPKTPDVLIVFDHSGSMGQKFGDGTRLTVEQAIIRDLVRSYQDKIRFGYQEFPMNTGWKKCPGGASCCSDEVVVKPDFMMFPPIDMAMKDCGGMGGSCSNVRIQTPTPDALRIAREFYAGFMDGIKERYVLLSTDGEPNCPTSPPPCPASVDGVAALLAAGVKTIVLGVSEEVGMSNCLNRMALAGGAPRMGGPEAYYNGKDPESLKRFLGEIFQGVAKPSCKIDLTQTPPDPNKIAVFFDQIQVPWDPGHMSGWDYEAGTTTQIVVYGDWCKRLEGFMVKIIDVRFGCRPCGATVRCD